MNISEEQKEVIKKYVGEETIYSLQNVGSFAESDYSLLLYNLECELATKDSYNEADQNEIDVLGVILNGTILGEGYSPELISLMKNIVIEMKTESNKLGGMRKMKTNGTQRLEDMVNLDGMDEKFIVIKKDDLKEALQGMDNQDLRDSFNMILDMVAVYREALGKKENKYLVVNRDESYSKEVEEILKRNGHWG